MDTQTIDRQHEELALDYVRQRGDQDGRIAGTRWADDVLQIGNLYSNHAELIQGAQAIFQGITSSDPDTLDALPLADLQETPTSSSLAEELTAGILVNEALASADIEAAAAEVTPDGQRSDLFWLLCDTYGTVFSETAEEVIAERTRQLFDAA